MPEVDHICQLINKYFGLKIKPWQFNILANIKQKKRNVYAIASPNASKSLIYQIILVVIGGSILDVLLTIAFIED